ncbi:MAG: hypothetical protein HY821_24685 [Acidobacteria bacterium]|nr:hypothetical protein [Acidobacteriota bacterium]
MNTSTMQEDNSNLQEILRFQQSLLRLVTQGGSQPPKSKSVVSQPAQQLEVWVRKIHPKAG